MLNESLNKYDYRKRLFVLLFIWHYWILYCILTSLILQSFIHRVCKSQINLNCNSYQAVRNEMLHDSYTPTQVDSVLCKVYWTICAEDRDCKIPFIIILFYFISFGKKVRVFWEVAPTFYCFFLMKRMSWRTFCCHCMNYRYLFWCDSCRV